MQQLIFRGLLGLTVLLTFACQHKIMGTTTQSNSEQPIQVDTNAGQEGAQTYQQFIQAAKLSQETQNTMRFPQS